MLESVRNREALIPWIPVHYLMAAGTASSFFWLLFQNKVHPVVVYLLQAYLTF